jgi:phosphopantothenoylcysteine decarboxylase/phosphopantothenate--cysteine ligase
VENVSGKRIVLGVGGGIAAYKVVELARELTQAGADVRVVMTRSATRFVGPITFSTLTGNRVHAGLFEEPDPPEVPHTSLARSADLIVVAPATANLIAKFALGISDDFLSALVLSFKGPVVIAPAMHTEMWENEATQSNAADLRARGFELVGPVEGPLAGSDSGIGRLSEVTELAARVDQVLKLRESLNGVRVLVTAGGTREPIDAVRFIGNRSSGRMGFALAQEAAARGAKVALISGPTHLRAPDAAETVMVETAEEMYRATMAAAGDADIVIMNAAVSDWRPSARESRKLKKSEGAPDVHLEATADILEELGKNRREGQVLVGFAAEVERLEERGREKLESKSLDLIVANLVGVEDSGFDVETSRGLMIDRLGNVEELPLASKRELASRVLDAISERLL